MGLKVQQLTANTDSDVILAGIFGTNDDDLTYLGLHQNLPAVHDTTMYLLTIIEEVGNIYDLINKEIANINSPSAILTLDHELPRVELVV